MQFVQTTFIALYNKCIQKHQQLSVLSVWLFKTLQKKVKYIPCLQTKSCNVNRDFHRQASLFQEWWQFKRFIPAFQCSCHSQSIALYMTIVAQLITHKTSEISLSKSSTSHINAISLQTWYTEFGGTEMRAAHHQVHAESELTLPNVIAFKCF